MLGAAALIARAAASLAERDRAKAALGPKWDVRDFNDALVATGGVPLTAPPGVVNRMIMAVTS